MKAKKEDYKNGYCILRPFLEARALLDLSDTRPPRWQLLKRDFIVKNLHFFYSLLDLFLFCFVGGLLINK